MKKIILLISTVSTLMYAKSIDFKQGWNFIGFHNEINIENDKYLTDSSKVYIVWSYTNDNDLKYWSVYSPNSSIKNKLSQYKALNTIKAYEGLWVYSKSPYSYIQDNSIVATKPLHTTEINQGWNLMSSSTGNNVDIDDLSEAKMIFTYRGDSWHAVNNIDNNNLYPKFSEIGSTEAYWAYYDEIEEEKEKVFSYETQANINLNISLSNFTSVQKQVLVYEQQKISSTPVGNLTSYENLLSDGVVNESGVYSSSLTLGKHIGSIWVVIPALSYEREHLIVQNKINIQISQGVE